MFDVDLLDSYEPSEVDHQAAHLFKPESLGIADIEEIWMSDPVFYPATPPAHWLMVAEVSGRVLVAPLAPSRSDRLDKCRPIGCYRASLALATRYLGDR